MAYTAIDNPELYFQVKLYTGNGSTQTITYDNTDADLDADMIWLKARNHAYSHQLFDTVRGATKLLNPEAGEAEQTLSGITAFATDTFAIGSDAGTNASDKTYVAWCWKESATSGFDMVSYSGNETNRTISHSLSAVPHLMIIKNRESTFNWVVYHHKNTSAPQTDYLYLATDAATADFDGHFNDTAPTSSVFTVGTDTGVNKNSQGHMNYLWTEKQGFSKFGSYEGNGADDGTFVWTGFRPAFLIIKRSSSTEDWYLYDNKRDGYNVIDTALAPSLNNAEFDTGAEIDFLSNGFKNRGTNTASNTDGETYLYIAFAEAPFVNSNGVPCNAR